MAKNDEQKRKLVTIALMIARELRDKSLSHRDMVNLLPNNYHKYALRDALNILMESEDIYKDENGDYALSPKNLE